MMRRPMRRGPGLLGMAARTAVVAGTATAVSGRMANRQATKQAAAAAAAEPAPAPPAAPEPPAPAPAPPAPAAADGPSLLDEIERLGQMHSQGLLTDDEFAAMKAKLLA